jgi:hypothetical protein
MGSTVEAIMSDKLFCPGIGVHSIIEMGKIASRRNKIKGPKILKSYLNYRKKNDHLEYIGAVPPSFPDFYPAIRLGLNILADDADIIHTRLNTTGR